MKKIAFLSCTLLSCSVFAAPIQQGSLSVNTPIAENNSGTTPLQQQPSQLWELRQLVDQLQTEVRQLRGQLEEKDNQIDQLTQDIKSRYDDLDQRLELLNQKVDPDSANTDDENNGPAETDQKPDATPASSPIGSNTATTNKPNTAKNDQEAYELAYEAYQQGGAAKAIKPMENFINQYPRSPYVSHAYYWLGEFHLSTTPPNFKAAKDNFSIVAGNYPQSSKAPISLYRLSEISKNITHNIPEAKDYYLRLIQKYPNSDEAQKAKKEINL
ncbi:tetratricopeptide repeat protein [Acinetobacter qingfengensis]|uniref:Uncharacterized protein n=1 Tax=Acinetobacter qingfengensis TaxID=1262585 RepID=A0A1E7RDX6_9GAMM|nr:YbgF trimerization domain-containing protein [Acinetobacter qingfengensis]KAA8734381.1 tetratricopeptide repeat protein [Acinetobacter qingfengensis]OEY97610.1 hypothetical protein BJI46_09010 [Acinetobacter qingfengensis]